MFIKRLLQPANSNLESNSLIGFTGGTFSYVIIPIELYGLFHFGFQHVFTYIDTDFLIKAVDEDSFKSDRLLHKAAKS